MKQISTHQRKPALPRCRGVLRLCVILFLFYRPDASAQLAITEVMSDGSTNGLINTLKRPDFWELTNFGTNTVNLAGYRWFDADDTPFEGRQLLPSISLAAGKSIIFVRDSTVIPNAAAFRDWWGSNVSPELPIHFWFISPGFDNQRGDSLRLWDAETNLVDEVRFETAQLGVTFTYDTNSGAFSEFSQENVDGAFRAAKGGDIGSPGYATKGPVPLRIAEQPMSQSADPGSEVILKVQASGRPGAQYQWYRNGIPVPATNGGPLAIPRLVCFANCGASWRRAPGPNDLLLQGIQPGQSGNYHVEAFNGLQRLTSTVALIAVNTNPSPVLVECPPEESCVPCIGTESAHLVARPGQTAIFTVRNRGFPLPTFQWSRSSDGVNFTILTGQTNRDLTLPNLQASHAGKYRVRLQNSNGATTAFAQLTIKPPPRLEITEAMAQACSALDRDWWELTNTGSEPVNLCGYRWDDGSARGNIGAGPTITNDVVVQPGASVILLESQTADSFVQWWGASNLPPNLQFITYAANGLGPDGDSLDLWDPNETDGLKTIHSVVFSRAIPGISRWFDLESALAGCKAAEDGAPNITNKCGAFRAGGGCEIGSPGWTRWTPPTLTSVRREGLGVALSWRAQPGSINRLQFARQLAAPLDAMVWENLGTFQSASAAVSTTDLTVGTEPQRFYRVVKVAGADCPCPE